MPELEIVKSLLQMGAAGILFLAGWGMLQFLREERDAQIKHEAALLSLFENVVQKLESLTHEVSTALYELKRSRGQRCPLTGADRAVVDEMERRIRERDNK